MLFIKKLPTLSVLIFTIFFSNTALPSTAGRELLIDGLRIFTQEEMKKILKLEQFLTGPDSGKVTADSIESFYRKNGYSLVKVYIVEDSPERLALYVNEGRLAKIIVHGLNNYYSLKVKQLINFPGRIYNIETSEQNISRIKKKYKFPSVKIELRRIADYSDSLFQLDRTLKKITILQDNLKIFSDYPPEYDLHIYPEKGSGTKGLRVSRDGISFNIDYDYPSTIIPEVSYYRDNLIYGKDYFEIEVSSGFDPGLKGFISTTPSNTLNLPPERSFSKVTAEYKFNPYKNDLWGPITRSILYQSKSSRPDLGLTKYEYLQSKTTLAPEFTFLNYFNIYAGLGYEKVYFYDIDEEDTATQYIEIKNNEESYPFFESRIKLDPIPIRIGNRIDKYLVFTFTEYFGSRTSRELSMQCAYDFEFSNLSIYSFKFKSNLNFYDTPFHHNAGVNSSFFKGFTGNGYYTNRAFSVSNEYRVSVYQDYIYAGAFTDYVVFKPGGVLMSGTKHGIAAGPTGRFLFYDQFEFIVYYSLDYLLPEGTSGTNLQMKFRKKW